MIPTIFRVSLALLLLLPAVATAGVTFTLVPPEKGDVRTITEYTNLELAISVMRGSSVAQELTQTRDSDELRKEEILEVADGKVTRLSITYTQQRETMTMDGSGSSNPSPVEGKTYLADLTGEEPVITNKSGDEVTDGELRLVLQDANEANDAALREYLAATTFEEGKSQNIPEDVLEETFSDEQLKAKRCSITLESVEEKKGMEVAQFVLSLQVVGAAEGVEIKSKWEGTLSVEVATTRLQRIVFKGPIAFSRRDNGMDIKAEGNLTARVSAKYSKKR